MPDLTINRWNGSLVTSIDPEEAVPGDFAKLENFVFDKTGLPRVRGGRRIWGSGSIGLSSSIEALYHFKQGHRQRQPRDFVVALTNNALYVSEYPTGSSPFHSIMPSDFKSFEERLIGSFCTIRDWLIITTNSEIHRRPFYWTGTGTIAELRGAPSATLCAKHASRLWLVDQDDPSTLHFSAPFAPNEWRVSSGAGFLRIQPGDGNVISALIPSFAGEMIIGKDGPTGGALYRLSGTSALDFQLTPLSTTIGPINHRAATIVGDRDVFFCSRRGIHSLRRVEQFGDLESSAIDYDVSDIWRGLPDRAKERAVAVDDYVNDTWWLFYDTDSDDSNDRGLLFNYRHISSRGRPKISEVDYGSNAAAMVRDAKAGRNVLMTSRSAIFPDVGVLAITENNEDAFDEISTTAWRDISWEAELMPIDADNWKDVKAWRELWLRFDVWGWIDLTVEWWADNQAPSTATISLNPDELPTEYRGEHRLDKIRLGPDLHRSNQIVHLRRGGVALHLKLNGTKGRIALRAFQLLYEIGMANLTSGRWLPYTEAGHT